MLRQEHIDVTLIQPSTGVWTGREFINPQTESLWHRVNTLPIVKFYKKWPPRDDHVTFLGSIQVFTSVSACCLKRSLPTTGRDGVGGTREKVWIIPVTVSNFSAWKERMVPESPASVMFSKKSISNWFFKATPQQSCRSWRGKASSLIPVSAPSNLPFFLP